MISDTRHLDTDVKKEPVLKGTEFSFLVKPSPLGGVGVFAAHDIPAGMEFFSGKTFTRKMKIKDLSPEFLKYCIMISETECLCPKQFDHLEIEWFLNHSDQPNISAKTGTYAVALRDIKAGEEILVNYNELQEPEHLKDDYYRNSMTSLEKN